MKNLKLVIFLCYIFGLSYATDFSPCGEWKPYKDEKCFQIFDKLGLQTFIDAEVSCSQQETGASLASIRSQEEQEFVSNFLFETSKLVDNVWLGAQRIKSNNSNEFKWIDGFNFDYSNWEKGHPTNEDGRDCIQMNSAFQFYFQNSAMDSTPAAGRWTDVPCQKKNLIVCQKLQNWPISRLQKILLDTRKEFQDSSENIKMQFKNQESKINDQELKIKDQESKIKNQESKIKDQESKIKDQESKIKDHELKIKDQESKIKNQESKIKDQESKIKDQESKIKDHELKIKDQASKIITQQSTINNLKMNPIPINFIYTQLSNQPDPKSLWPTVKWKDVTSEYSGLFFRAVGNNSAAFGTMQEDNAPRVTQVTRDINIKNDKPLITLRPNSWSEDIYTGSHDGTSNYVRFYTSAGEVRPRNKAIRIWKRTG